MKLSTQTDACLPGSMLVEFQQAYNPALRRLPGKTPGTKHSLRLNKANLRPGSSHPGWRRKKKEGEQEGEGEGAVALTFSSTLSAPNPLTHTKVSVELERWGEDSYPSILIIYCG